MLEAQPSFAPRLPSEKVGKVAGDLTIKHEDLYVMIAKLGNVISKTMGFMNLYDGLVHTFFFMTLTYQTGLFISISSVVYIPHLTNHEKHAFGGATKRYNFVKYITNMN